ncbi:MAG: YjjG family noncanonical pyrimidine nucleotidase [Cyclobacteriaceae bacterium]
MKNIKHLFFDLDHTLWDYDFNARKVLNEMYDLFQLAENTNTSKDGFLKVYFKENAKLWHAYNLGEIDRKHIRDYRFVNVLKACAGSKMDISMEMSHHFIYHCPRQTRVMDGALMTLDYLRQKYRMSVITNGFDDVQEIKLQLSGLAPYFEEVITSETTGHKKPAKEIYEYALGKVGCSAEEVLMIGDNHTADVQGALSAGIRPIFFNPGLSYKSACEIQIEQLSELMRLL